MTALSDDDITEVMANPDGKVWLESRKRGMYHATDIDDHSAQNALMQLAMIKGVYLNEERPYIESNLPFNNERIEGTISPVTRQASFTIRKPAKFVYKLEDYLERGIINKAQFDVICSALKERKNMIMSGGPGTGKTTLANAIIQKMTEISDQSQRILILEDTPEIQCKMPNVLSMVTCDSVDTTTLLRIAMRSRPDRIFVGEVRDKAALDLLKAWNTGCPGGISTLHANSSEAIVQRLLDLTQEANIPPPYGLVAETVNILISVKREPLHPAGRVVHEITALNGYKDGQFQFQQLAINQEWKL